MGNGSVPWLFPINISTFPAARSILVPGLHPLLHLGRSCSHRVFGSAFPETQIQGKIRLYSCAEKATGLSQRWDRDPGVRHSRLREQQHPRTGITQAQRLQGREGGGHSCLQGLGRSITNNASQYICLAGNVPGTSL